jgi:hypothetical protein
VKWLRTGGRAPALIYRLAIAAIVLIIVVNVFVIGTFESARYNVPLLLAIPPLIYGAFAIEQAERQISRSRTCLLPSRSSVCGWFNSQEGFFP